MDESQRQILHSWSGWGKVIMTAARPRIVYVKVRTDRRGLEWDRFWMVIDGE